MERIMAIDYGTVRTGVAVSDPLGLIARALEQIPSKEGSVFVINRLKVLIAEYEIKTVIIGLPRRTDGKRSDWETEVRRFAREFEELSGIRPLLRDERYTSVIAGRILTESNVRKDKRKGLVDQISAEILLQDYLESQR